MLDDGSLSCSICFNSATTPLRRFAGGGPVEYALSVDSGSPESLSDCYFFGFFMNRAIVLSAFQNDFCDYVIFVLQVLVLKSWIKK